jgi:hypothetical protein
VALLAIKILDDSERAVDVAAARIVLGEHHRRAGFELE